MAKASKDAKGAKGNKGKAQAAPPPARGRTGMWGVLISLTLAAMAMVSLPTLVLMLFGMIPAIVALVVDRGKEKYTAISVGGMNFAGLAPFLFSLWHGAHTSDHALSILMDPYSLFVIYGAASIGWLLIIGLPPVFGAFLSQKAQKRISALRAAQKTLVEEWGGEIASPVDAAVSRRSGR